MNTVIVTVRSNNGPGNFNPPTMMLLTRKLRQRVGVLNVVPAMSPDAESLTFQITYADDAPNSFDQEIQQWFHRDLERPDLDVTAEPGGGE